MKKYRKGKHEYTELGKGSRRINVIKKELRKDKNMDEKENNQKKKIPVKMDDEIAMGRYTNFCMITHTPDDFTLDFMYMPPGQPGTVEAKAVSRLITSPGHAKRLLMALNENVSRYEAKHGDILPSKGPEKKGSLN
ncbi:MAG: DUF3467 domain-containing protein [Elusimicrobiota bacterium]